MALRIDRSKRSPSYSSRRGKDVTMLVVHATAGTSSLGWLISRKSRVSAHYLIGKDGTINELVDESFAAWHAGSASWAGEYRVNEVSVGIELENRNDGKDPYPKAQLDALVWLSREIVTRHNISFSHIVRHKEIAIPAGRKSDPAGFPRWMDWFVPTVVGQPTEWRWYRVWPWATAGYVVRAQPTKESTRLNILMPWSTLLGRTVRGGKHAGSDVWVQRSPEQGGGFVHSGGLEVVP